MQQKLYIFIFAIGILYTSCKSTKSSRTELSTTKSTETAGSKNNEQKELTLFFEAETARLNGEFLLSLKLYEQLIAAYPNNATAHYNLARLYYRRQQTSKAIIHAEKAKNLQPNNKYFQELYTQLLVYTNNTKQAENQYNDLISKNPANDEYLYKKAQLQIKSKEYDKAINTLEELEKKTGFNEDIILQKKNIFLKTNQNNKAIAEVNKLIQNDPSNTQYLMVLIELYDSIKDTVSAEKVYQKLEKDFVNDPLSQAVLAQYYLDNKNYKKFNDYIQRIIQNKNLDVDTKISFLIPTIQMLNQDSIEDKKSILLMVEKLAQEAPNHKDALLLYADVLYMNKENEKALTYYNKSLLLDPSRINTWTQIISIYTELAQHDSVIAVTDRCLTLYPNNALVYFYKGLAYYFKKDYLKSISTYNKAIDLEDQNSLLNAQIYSSLAETYHLIKQYSESDSCYEKALQLNPDDATTLNNYAYYLSLRKIRLNDAEKMSKKSLKLQPDFKSYLDTYGWILFQQGKYNEAKTFIEKAILQVDDNDATLYDHLGDIYFKLNNVEKAIENWKKALKQEPDNLLIQRKIKDEKWYEE